MDGARRRPDDFTRPGRGELVANLKTALAFNNVVELVLSGVVVGRLVRPVESRQVL